MCSLFAMSGGETRTEKEESTPKEHISKESESHRPTLGGQPGNASWHLDLGSSLEWQHGHWIVKKTESKRRDFTEGSARHRRPVLSRAERSVRS